MQYSAVVNVSQAQGRKGVYIVELINVCLRLSILSTMHDFDLQAPLNLMLPEFYKKRKVKGRLIFNCPAKEVSMCPFKEIYGQRVLQLSG